MTKNLGLYIHIPFCKEKCSYCDFYSLKTDDTLIENFVDSLVSHIKEYASFSKNYKIDTLYIGGGTPSVIGYKNLVKIIKTVKKNFNIYDNAEITVELNPESTDEKLLKKLFKEGANRLSFGVQSSDDEKLLSLGRLHNFDTARNAILLAKKVGFKNISADLIYGLASQTMADVENDLSSFLALNLNHISTYCLKLEEGTKLFNENPTLPDDDLVADMYDYICQTLGSNGFSHYEISNFSKNGLDSRHNMKYWNLSEYLGLGPSAHSLFGNVRFSFESNLNKYIANHTISEKDEEIPFKSRFGEYIMLKLRTKNGINIDEFYNLFNINFDFNDKFIKTGHAEYKNGNYFLTEKGFYISNYIINELITSTI